MQLTLSFPVAGLVPATHVFAKHTAARERRGWPGQADGCPVEQLGQCGIERRELQCNCKYPLPGLVPGTHVLTAEITKAQEDVDGRVKPGQGDLRLCMDRWRQPVSPQPDSRGTSPAMGR